jgi:hypothetical protein
MTMIVHNEQRVFVVMFDDMPVDFDIQEQPRIALGFKCRNPTVVPEILRENLLKPLNLGVTCQKRQSFSQGCSWSLVCTSCIWPLD